MKKIIGMIVIVIGICLAFYISGYLMFFHGIIQIIEQVQAKELVQTVLAIGIIKVMFATVAGAVIVQTSMFISMLLNKN